MKKFISLNLHAKFFLVGLFMSLNLTDPVLIEKSKLLTVSTLPMLFDLLPLRK